MQLDISTTAQNGQLLLYVINSSGIKILTLKDTDQGKCLLVPGHTYRLEWHSWSPQAAHYEIAAHIDPSTDGFPPFDFKRDYDGPKSDMGGFYFTV